MDRRRFLLTSLTDSLVGPLTTDGPARPWARVCFATSLLFLALAVLVRLAGVLEVERALYETFVAAVPTRDPWRWITRLGSETILFPASAFLIIALPQQFYRHWWLWVVVMLATSGLEGLGKEAIGRLRPETLRPGFPSGHTSAAAAFYLMAAYFAAAAVPCRWSKRGCYALAAVVIGLVALSRMALRAHWPLDVLGGAALGVGVVAAAVWWHERHPDAWKGLVFVPPAWRHAIYRWQNVIQLALVAVLLLKPPMAEEDTLLDLAFDVCGGLSIAAGLLLRLWVAGHAKKGTLFRELPGRFVSSGPYAYMRQPLPLSTLLIGLGVVILAESAPGLMLVPIVLCVMYRITIPLEEAHLVARAGRAYTDYCARVPRFPRPTAAVIAAGSMAVVRPGATPWRSIRQELPALGTILGLSVLAETHKFLPHLWR